MTIMASGDWGVRAAGLIFGGNANPLISGAPAFLAGGAP